jgi:hypothetical protein
VSPVDDFHTLLFEPNVKCAWIEANEPPNFEVGNPSFGHEALDVTTGDTECLGDIVYVQQRCPAFHRN